jgi:hypothetical protein
VGDRFNLIKIHLLFRIMILIQWSVNISVFVNHVVIVFWGPNEGDRKRTYIPRLFLTTDDLQHYLSCNVLCFLFNTLNCIFTFV